VTETVSTAYAVTTAATCGAAGVGTYTATFTNSLFSTQSKTADISAIDHSYGTPTYVWSADNSTVTATSVCAHDATHVVTETVSTAYAVTTAATCEAAGVGTYTATFANSLFSTQSRTAAIPAMGHDWTPTSWNWTGYTAAEAVFTCRNDSSHVKTVSAVITGARTEATEETDAFVTHTAAVTLEGQEYTDVRVETIPRYTVRFVNEDGEELQSLRVEVGTVPVYTGETPTKEPTADSIFTFAGWTPALAAITGETTYTAVYTAEHVDAEYKLEIRTLEEAFNSYPQAILDKYGSAENMANALIASLVSQGVPANQTEIYDLVLQFSIDGGVTWIDADADNFPAGGIPISLPYPEGINPSRYRFVLNHLIINPLNTGKTAGQIESMPIILAADGIHSITRSLSPFILGWSANKPSVPLPAIFRISTLNSEHGQVTLSTDKAPNDWPVTFTVRPNAGYEVDSVTVRSTSGRVIPVTVNGDGSYTFTQIPGNVEVAVSFRRTFSNPFDDVAESAYYYDAVLWAAEKGITDGTGEKTFSPNGDCTRAQMVTFLWKAIGSPEPEARTSPFEDVAESAYYYKAVLWAVESGITDGTGENTFSPNESCTRAQMAAFLWRANSSPKPASAKEPFEDVAESAYYYKAVLWAVENGITDGTGEKTFSPNSRCTRSQIVTFLYRAYGEGTDQP